MRYRIESFAPEGGEKELLVTVFPGPYGFDATPEELKRTASFAFSDEGLDQICDYLNRTYEDSPETWEAGKRLL